MKTLNDRLQEGKQLQQAIDNLNQSYERRNSRIKKRLEKMLQQEFKYFITFTISPQNYGLKYNTYLRKIKEALASASGWVVNSDYGDINGRLHFHCIATFYDQLDYTILNDKYQYGSINYEPINRPNEKGLREYLNKTVNHTIKQTTGKIHYSR